MSKRADALAREHTEAAIAVLAEVMYEGDAKHADRIKAADSILDRGHGKAQQAIIAAFHGNAFTEVFTYPGCRHAFARHRGIHFDRNAAQLANHRTADFFQLHLA